MDRRDALARLGKAFSQRCNDLSAIADLAASLQLEQVDVLSSLPRQSIARSICREWKFKATGQVKSAEGTLTSANNDGLCRKDSMKLPFHSALPPSLIPALHAGRVCAEAEEFSANYENAMT